MKGARRAGLQKLALKGVKPHTRFLKETEDHVLSIVYVPNSMVNQLEKGMNLNLYND
jgi:hypothetical protein